MLEIVQPGQAGKTSLLLDMHRLRKRVFKDRMGWEVSINSHGLEVDQFDFPETVYLLALDDERQVIGNWRLLPTIGPTMIRDVWPEFLETIDMKLDPYSWEVSRFAVDSHLGNSKAAVRQINTATAELFCGMTELSLLCGIKRIYTMYDDKIARVLRKIDCEPIKVSAQLKVSNTSAQVGVFLTDEVMLARLRHATGISEPLITKEMLPPYLDDFRRQMGARIQDNKPRHTSDAKHSAAV